VTESSQPSNFPVPRPVVPHDIGVLSRLGGEVSLLSLIQRVCVRSDYYAQVDNGDPFAPPAWRSPVYRTPESAILAVQFARTLWRPSWFTRLVAVPARSRWR
jgi:hypothetical protein